jgi:hypothetical protein
MKGAFVIAAALTVALAGSVCAEDRIGVLLAVGDIANCSDNPIRNGQETAKLVQAEIKRAKDDNLPVKILALGDLAYGEGTPAQFGCFKKTWGDLKADILPTPGNHDWLFRNGKAYFDYFVDNEAEKTNPRKGYYFIDFPSKNPWRLIALNTNTDFDEGGQQIKRIKADLKATNDRTKNYRRCVLAFSHAFLYSSGRHGHGQNSTIDLTKPLKTGRTMRAAFNALYEGRASLVVSGHDHHFEQLGRANHEGKAADDGVRSFIVGTGGNALHSEHPKGNTNDYKEKWDFMEAIDLTSYGILRIELYPDSYTWAFLSTKPDQNSMTIKKDTTRDTCNRDP